MTSTTDMNESYKKYNKRQKLLKSIRLIFVQLFMTIFAAITLYPFVVMLFVSVKSSREAVVSPSSIPTEVHLENFVEVWHMMEYPRVFWNTFIITSVSVLGIVAITGLAAYIIAWSKRKKFYTGFYIFFLCGLMIPFYTALVPLVKLMTDLGLTNSKIGMILYYCGRNVPLAVFLYVGFIRSVSGEILEAGRIDGANIWVLYWRVLFPIMKPITSTIIILDAMHLWNDFLFPRMMLTRSRLRTIALTQFYFTGEYGNKYELAFSAYLLTILPILILYFSMQRNIIKGVSAGAVKG